MAKYTPLRDYLRQQNVDELDLTFKQIEQIIDAALPRSSSRPQWWENSQSDHGHTQREAWRDAGYDAFLIASSKRVKFRRVGAGRK